MPGFSYGGVGDGTNWSSERGSGPAPGGGSTGNSGNRDNGGSVSQTPARQRQITAIQRDPALRTKISRIISAARAINPSVTFTVSHISPEGIMTVVVRGINPDQGKKIGLGGLLMGFYTPAFVATVGEIDTGYKYAPRDTEKSSNTGYGGVEMFTFLKGAPLNYERNYKGWEFVEDKKFTYTGNKIPMLLVKDLTLSSVDKVDTYNLHYLNENKYVNFKVVIVNGDLNNMKVTHTGPVSSVFTDKHAKETVKNFAPLVKEAETELLQKSAEIIISVGDKTGEFLGDKYKALAKDISDNVRNFQGRHIRSYEEAVRSLNKLLNNPNMRINAADRTAIINAWKSLNADNLGNKFAGLGKTFKMADYAMKANSVKDKSIEGYKTGDWGPLVREVEAWVLSGIASSIALAVFSVTLGGMLVWAGLSVAAIGIIGVMVAGLIGSLIDDKFVDRLNNEIIRPAH